MKNRSKTKVTHTFLLAATLGSLLASVPASSASLCKGLENSACAAKSSCGWVEGYERKDGRKVKSFCRTKSGANKLGANKKASDSATTSANKKTS